MQFNVQVMGVVMSVRRARRNKYAHNVSKWRPTMSLATECAEKVRSENLKLRYNNGATDLRTITVTSLHIYRIQATAVWPHGRSFEHEIVADFSPASLPVF